MLFSFSSFDWYCSHFFITWYPVEIMISGWASNMAATKLWQLRRYPMNSTNSSTPSYTPNSFSAGERKGVSSKKRNQISAWHQFIVYPKSFWVRKLLSFVNRVQKCMVALQVFKSVMPSVLKSPRRFGCGPSSVKKFERWFQFLNQLANFFTDEGLRPKRLGLVAEEPYILLLCF